MSTSTPAAWYPDPAGSGQLRYWDGSQWTQHLAPPAGQPSTPSAGQPQQAPTQPEQSPTVPPSAPQGDQHTSQSQPHPQASQYPPQAQQYPSQGQTSSPASQYPPQTQQYASQAQQYPPQSQQYPHQGQPYMAQQPWAQDPQGKATTTPDGVPLASYGSRVGAALLDGLITTTIGMVLSSPFLAAFFTWFGQYMENASYSGRADQAYIQAQVLYYLWPVTVITLLVHVTYQVAFLTWRGATLGKMAVNIRVRTWDAPGNPSLVVALRRQVVYIATSLAGLLPAIGTLGSIASLTDVLWPLWDKRRQALHDKVAGTVVVNAPQRS